MTTFFNKKEEVISLELTQHGKFLLSQGRFLPAHYSFYDDDILYDGGHGAVVSGSQNENLTRINSTQRVKQNPSYPLAVEKSSLNDINAATTRTANLAHNAPLGKSDPWKEYAPAWSIRPILDSILMTSGSLNQGVSVAYKRYDGKGSNIPQINIEIKYEYETGQGDDDNMKVLKESPRLLLAVEELNTIFKRDKNFEIEVFELTREVVEIVEDEDGEEFAALGTTAERRALGLTESDPGYHAFATSEAQTEEDYPALNRNHVEYYLSYKRDSEIESLDFPTDSNPLYQSRVTDENVGDDCDD